MSRVVSLLPRIQRDAGNAAMTRIWKFTAAAAALLGIALSSQAIAQEKRAEVIHFLTATSESAAIGEFAKAFKERGGTWVDSAVAGGATAKTLAINRIMGGTPPAAAMFN